MSQSVVDSRESLVTVGSESRVVGRESEPVASRLIRLLSDDYRLIYRLRLPTADYRLQEVLLVRFSEAGETRSAPAS